VFFGLPDPDPLVRGMVWIRIRILLSSCKINKKNLESYYFVTLFDFLCLKNNVNVPSKSNRQNAGTSPVPEKVEGCLNAGAVG
jgi:hypothetical protein